MNPAFIYLGRDERIAQEVEKHSDKINQAYSELLGPQRYEELVRTNAQLLTPFSFMENVSQLEVFGFKPSGRESSKFIMACSAKDSEVYTKNPNEVIRVAPAFYVSETSFNNSGSKRFTNNPLATYIHEFNHYLAFALQRVPIYFASMLLGNETNGQIRKEGLENYLSGALTDAAPPKVKAKRLGATLAQIMFDQSFEQINRIVDAKIMGSIGIKFKNPDRGREKKYFVMPVPGLGTFGIPIAGDAFYGLSDKEAFERYMNWEKHFTLMGVSAGRDSNEIMNEFTNLIRKTSALNLKKITFQDLEFYDSDSEGKR